PKRPTFETPEWLHPLTPSLCRPCPCCSESRSLRGRNPLLLLRGTPQTVRQGRNRSLCRLTASPTLHQPTTKRRPCQPREKPSLRVSVTQLNRLLRQTQKLPWLQMPKRSLTSRDVFGSPVGVQTASPKHRAYPLRCLSSLV